MGRMPRSLTRRLPPQSAAPSADTAAAATPSALSLGLVRKVSVKGAGSTTSRLAGMDLEARLSWEVLSQTDCDYTLKVFGRANPVTSILLDDVHCCVEVCVPSILTVSTVCFCGRYDDPQTKDKHISDSSSEALGRD